MGIAGFVQGLQQRSGLSAEALAIRAGLDPTTIRRWAHGVSRPSTEALRLLLQALACTREEYIEALALLDEPRAFREFVRIVDSCGNLPQEASEVVPGIGDLLRALRTRRGISEEELAESLGVSPTRVSKWERCRETVPDELVRRLLDLVGARPEERQALQERRLLLAQPWHEQRVSLELTMERFATIVARTNSFQSFAGDLEFLALEAALLPHVGERVAARLLLVRVWIEHAGYLLGRRRPKEAMRFAHYALETVETCGMPNETWIQAAHVTASAMSHSGKGTAREALNILGDRLPIAAELGLDVGLYRDMAHLAHVRRRFCEAAELLALSRQAACRISDDRGLRLTDFMQARLLFEQADFARAETYLPRDPDPHPSQFLFEAQLGARLAAALNRQRDVDQWLRVLRRHIDDHPDLEPYWPACAEIARAAD